MADKTHEIKRNRRLRQKWLSAACALLLLVFLVAGF